MAKVIKIPAGPAQEPERTTQGLLSPYHVFRVNAHGLLIRKNHFGLLDDAEALAKTLEATGDIVLILDLTAVGHGIPY